MAEDSKKLQKLEPFPLSPHPPSLFPTSHFGFSLGDAGWTTPSFKHFSFLPCTYYFIVCFLIHLEAFIFPFLMLSSCSAVNFGFGGCSASLMLPLSFSSASAWFKLCDLIILCFLPGLLSELVIFKNLIDYGWSPSFSFIIVLYSST